jgi:predicted MFS family arabinose efflux permease
VTRIFVGFAVAYFLSALLRAVTATLAPAFSAELGLGSGDLGLLAGAYFFGFALLQLPLGQALDRHGPRRVQFTLMLLAVAGCGLFALAGSLAGLLAARVLIGMGVAACLMAPLTAYRRHFPPAAQLRANSWMLMTGSLGMVASTLPVQWLLPVLGWRGLFVALAAALALSMAVMLWLVPRDTPAPATPAEADAGYATILRHPLFARLAPLAFLQYGGLIAVQALWAGPWLTQVAGWTPAAAAGGLFGINLAMLFTFLAWGALMPRLAARGVHALGVLAWGMPLALALLAGIVLAGPAAGAAAWAAWCVAGTCVSLSQPAVGQAFPEAQAGRALSAYNLVIFSGVFAVQWGIGLAIDALRAAGLAPVAAYQVAFGGYGLLCLGAYVWFLRRRA